MIEAKLIVVGGDVKTPEVKLKLPTTIGRGREASLTLPHALVSRLHCEIFERDGQMFVRDLGSLNGTFINNLRIDQEQPLLPDELLTLGTITFRASYQTAATAASPTAQPSAGSANTAYPIDGLSSQGQLSVAPPSLAASTATTAMPAITAEIQQPTATPTVGTALPNVPSVASSPGTVAPVPTPPLVGNRPNPTSQPADSDIFAGLLDDPAPDQSVSLSALANLPTANPQVSFVGNLPGLDDLPARTLDIDLEEISIAPDDSNKTGAKNIDDSQLGNFLRNMPK